MEKVNHHHEILHIVKDGSHKRRVRDTVSLSCVFMTCVNRSTAAKFIHVRLKCITTAVEFVWDPTLRIESIHILFQVGLNVSLILNQMCKVMQHYCAVCFFDKKCMAATAGWAVWTVVERNVSQKAKSYGLILCLCSVDELQTHLC